MPVPSAIASPARAAAAFVLLFLLTSCGTEPARTGDPAAERAFLDQAAQRAATARNSTVAGDQQPVQEVNPDRAFPKIEVETERLDVGVISNDVTTVERIRIHNQGEGILHITGLHTTCGVCTIPSMEERYIEPGEFEYLDIAIDPFGVAGFSTHKVVTVVCNDPEQSHTEIHVLADIEPEFELVPPSFEFGVLERGDAPQINAIFRQLDDAPIEVLELAPQSGRDYLDLGFSRLPEDEWKEPGKREYRIRVRLNTARIPNGSFNAAFSIVTTCERAPRFVVPLSGTMDSFYSIEPNPLRMGIVRPEEDRDFTLEVRSDRPFAIENLSVNGAGLEASVAEDAQGINQIITVTLGDSSEQPTIRGTVDFDVVADGTAYPTSIPYHAVLMGGSRGRGALDRP